MAEAEEFFVKEGYQPRPSARSETKRGTSDATYGYYTMGKLMILKLRDDYKAKMGAGYTLQNFHDTFISPGAVAAAAHPEGHARRNGAVVFALDCAAYMDERPDQRVEPVAETAAPMAVDVRPPRAVCLTR